MSHERKTKPSPEGPSVRGITPEELIQELEENVTRYRENKYQFQVGLKDLDFEVDEEKRDELGTELPFDSIDQAEEALRQGVIIPVKFIEQDNTEHQVKIFDHRPVGYSGFMDCVTHSLAITDHGLFEVGRYPAMRLSGQHRYWGWFLHRQLASKEQVAEWMETNDISPQELVDRVYTALIES